LFDIRVLIPGREDTLDFELELEMSPPLRFLTLAIGVVFLGNHPALADAPKVEPYKFEEALQKGAVDLSSNYWTGHDRAPLIAQLAKIDPGLVNRFAFFYGGANRQDVLETKTITGVIHSAVPRALMGATLPEHIRVDYDTKLSCPGTGETRYTAQGIGNQHQSDKLVWLDISRPISSDYYICLGRQYIDMGFSFIHFENAGGVIAHSADPNAALRMLTGVARVLRDYATIGRRPLYLSGDPATAVPLKLDAVYEPSRFYHLEPAYQKFQNKVLRPGHGIGYSYVLSRNIIAEEKSLLPSGVAVLFYVDNWNSDEDDLRRMMELDVDNRRFLIAQSLIVARQNGAYFVPSLDHCVGCIPANDVIDKCEILPNNQTQYDAFSCEDIPILAKYLH
jgi:hypothetical protein